MRRSVIGAAVLAMLTLVALPGGRSAAETAIWNLSESQEQELAAYQERAQLSGALGFYRDTATASLVVLVASDRRALRLDALGASPVPVSLKISEATQSEFAIARKRLDALPENGLPIGSSFAYVFDPALGKFEVTTTAEPALLETLLGSSWPLIAYQRGEVGLTVCNRTNDCAPFRGGALVTTEHPQGTISCTTAFTMVNGSGQRAMAMPAHCNGPDFDIRTFETGGGRRVGTSANRYCGYDVSPAANDVMLIKTESYGSDVYLGSATSGTTGYVDSGGNPAVGATYRFSGAVSGERTNQLVDSLEGQFWTWESQDWCGTNNTNPNSGFWTSNLIRFSRNDQCDGVPGDSGAPFYFKYNSSAGLLIRGMVVARWPLTAPNDCFAMKYTKMRDVLGWSIYAP